MLEDDRGQIGTGLAFTLGDGNDLVCRAAQFYVERLRGRDIEQVMAGFGSLQREMADEQQFRWLGPHKGVVHLALGSVTNACFDLWARRRGVPLWKLLVDLEPQALVALLDLSYLEDVLTAQAAVEMIDVELAGRPARETIVRSGYPGYDTSVGWFNYTDDEIRRNCRAAVDAGFTAMKLKVGSHDHDRDVRRAELVREAAGPGVRVMVDANQQWSLPEAITICGRLRAIDPYWIEEPTHPDDVHAHAVLAESIAPVRLALGEHVPNRVVFNHIALGHPALFLEHIPHLRDRFTHPARVEDGRYRIPQEPGSSCDLI